MTDLIIWIIVVAAFAMIGVWALRTLAPPDPIGRVGYVVIVGVALVLILAAVARMLGVETGLPSP